MQVEQNLSEYGKFMLDNIRNGIEIYKSKLNEEKTNIASSIGKLLQILSDIKDNFIHHTAKIEQRYFELDKRVEFTQKQNFVNIVDTANEINSYFSKLNKDFTDFMKITKTSIKNKILEEVQKFVSTECQNLEIIPKNKSQHGNQLKTFKKIEIEEKIISSKESDYSNVYHINQVPRALNSNQIMSGEKIRNEDKEKINTHRNNFNDNIIDKNNDYSNSITTNNKNEKRFPSSNNNLSNEKMKENNSQGNHNWNYNCSNNLDNSQFWNHVDDTKKDGNGNTRYSDAIQNKEASNKFENTIIIDSDSNDQDHLLSRKRFKPTKTEKLDHKFNKIISDKQYNYKC